MTATTFPVAVRSTWAAPAGLVPLLILVAAVLIRAPAFGNPTYEYDEQFYLLAGERLLHGALPYVDVWDRKPLGLFLLYAAMRAIPGDPVLVVHLAATFAAAATALCIRAAARPAAGGFAASIAAILYLLWIEMAEGGGGQAPVFYNLPVAAAAALLLPGGAGWRRPAAMALLGVAVQIKPTVLPEALLFLGIAIRRARPPQAALCLLALAAPSLLAFGCYAAIGRAGTMAFATIGSFFLRNPAGLPLHMTASLALLPLGCCAAIALPCWPAAERRRLLAWLATASGAVALVGLAYAHYLLPLFVPLAIAAAPAFQATPTGLAAAALVAWLPLANPLYPSAAAAAQARTKLAALARLVPSEATHGCLYVADAPPALQRVTGACTVTRFLFPDHLIARAEASAIGIDPVDELKAIFARRPLAVAWSRTPRLPRNPRAVDVIETALGRDYVRVGVAPAMGREVGIYLRRARRR